MSTYHVKSDPAFTLPQLTSAIRFEEAGASKFTGGVVILQPDGTKTNLLDFDELPPGTVPLQPTIVASGAAGPAGTAKFWSGTLLVSAVSTAVDGWR